MNPRRFGHGLAVVPTRRRHAAALAELQTIVFPTLAPAERFTAANYRKHVAVFADGQWCVIQRVNRRVVGATSTIRLDFDFEHPGHRFADIIRGGTLTSHQPAGRWLYGADVGVHPAFRGRGIARALYAMRQVVVRRLGLEGQVTVGMPSGYGAVKHRITAEAYYAELVAGTRRDPTISAQLAIGFEPRGLLPNYLDDPVCDGYGVVLVLPAAREVAFPR